MVMAQVLQNHCSYQFLIYILQQKFLPLLSALRTIYRDLKWLFPFLALFACFMEKQVHGTLHTVILDADLLTATFLKGKVCGLLYQYHNHAEGWKKDRHAKSKGMTTCNWTTK